jgi:hypothetical protein
VPLFSLCLLCDFAGVRFLVIRNVFCDRLMNPENNKKLGRYIMQDISHVSGQSEFDRIWALFQETREQIKETGAQLKETDRILSQRFRETDERIKETDKILYERFNSTLLDYSVGLMGPMGLMEHITPIGPISPINLINQ